MCKLSRILLLVFVLLPQIIFCQKEENQQDYCFTLDNLIYMVNQRDSIESDTLVQQLTRDKGFQWSSDSISYECIYNNILLQYHSANVFYDNINWDNPAIIIFASADGLSNIVKLKLSKSMCPGSMRTEFAKNNFHPSNSGQMYNGHLMIDGKANHYEIDYNEDTVFVEITIRNKGEIDEYTKKQAKDKEKAIYSKMEKANKLCEASVYNEAYLTIDSAMGIYKPMDSTLFVLRKKIRDNQIHFLYDKLSEAVNQNSNIKEGISLCNEILVLDNQNDSVNEIRKILIGTTRKDYQLYSKLNPIGYNSVISSLESIVNNEILKNPSPQKQTLSLNFTFQTDQTNKSNGNVELNLFEQDGFTQIEQNKFSSRSSMLNRYVSSIAVSPFITTITQYGVMVNTKENISYSVEWKCQDKIVKMIRGKSISSNNTLKPYIDSVNAVYLKNISPKTKKDTLPYKVIYTVTQWDKRCNGNISSDLRITDIKTSSNISWLPSLVVPGVGTYIQGYHSSIVARALPFYMFTSVAIVALSWEAGKGKTIERPGWKDERGSSSRFWEYKNFGYIAGYLCLTVAATIYINDLVESIVASQRNLKRTQRLRDAFDRNKYIDLQTQDMRIEQKK